METSHQLRLWNKGQPSILDPLRYLVQERDNTIGGEETDERVKESEGKELGGIHETEVTRYVEDQNLLLRN